jgi:hypothetical protein
MSWTLMLSSLPFHFSLFSMWCLGFSYKTDSRTETVIRAGLPWCPALQEKRQFLPCSACPTGRQEQGTWQGRAIFFALVILFKYKFDNFDWYIPELSTGQGGPAVLASCPVLSCRTGQSENCRPVLQPARTDKGRTQDRTGRMCRSCI